MQCLRNLELPYPHKSANDRRVGLNPSSLLGLGGKGIHIRDITRGNTILHTSIYITQVVFKGSLPPSMQIPLLSRATRFQLSPFSFFSLLLSQTISTGSICCFKYLRYLPETTANRLPYMTPTASPSSCTNETRPQLSEECNGPVIR